MSKRADSLHPKIKARDVSWEHENTKTGHRNLIRRTESYASRALRRQIKEYLRIYSNNESLNDVLGQKY